MPCVRTDYSVHSYSLDVIACACARKCYLLLASLVAASRIGFCGLWGRLEDKAVHDGLRCGGMVVDEASTDAV